MRGSRFSSSLVRNAPPLWMAAASIMGTPEGATPGAELLRVKVPALVVPTFWKVAIGSTSF